MLDDDRQLFLAIVEDDASYRRSLGRLCRLLGFTTSEFASGAEFLTALDSTFRRFDCLIIDKMMPWMTGLELHAILQERGMSLPAVLITGDADAQTRSSCAGAGVPCLEKPIRAETLRAVVMQTVRRHAASH